MKTLARLRCFAQWLLRRERVEQDLDAELRTFVEMATMAGLRDGLSEDEARRLAHLRLGGVQQVKDNVRGSRWGAWPDAIAREIRFGVRGCLRNPGFSTIAVLTLGIGIGAATLVFSVVYGVVLRPLAFPSQDRILRLTQIGASGVLDPFSDPNFDDVSALSSSFDTMAQYRPQTRLAVAGTIGSRVIMASVSKRFFDVLGVFPSRGRLFAPDELTPNGPAVALVSERFWRQHFSNVGDLASARLKLDGQPFTVVGIIPAALVFPPGADVWTPKERLPHNPFRTANNSQVIGRLKDNVALDVARAELDGIARRLKAEYGSGTYMVGVRAVRVLDDLVGSTRPTLVLLLAAVTLVLTIACANLANALLARTFARRSEFAVRAALGAHGFRVVTPILVEMLILSITGGCIGVVLAATGVNVLRLLDGLSLPRSAEISLNWEVVAFAMAAALVTAVCISVVTAWQMWRANIAIGLSDGTRVQVSSRSGRRTRRLLVVSQLAGSIVLMVGAGLLGRSLIELLNQNTGFRRSGVLTIDLTTPTPTYQLTDTALTFDDPEALARQASLNTHLIERLRGLPGVMETGGVSELPMQGTGTFGEFLILDGNDATAITTFKDLEAFSGNASRTGKAAWVVATGDYFRAMGIPLLRGRLFDERDIAGAPHVAVISESLARTRWPNRDPIGVQVNQGGMDGDFHPLTIVGIVGDVLEAGLDSHPRPTFYADYRQRPVETFDFSLVLQSSVPPETLVPAVRRAITDINPELAPRVRTVTEIVNASVAGRKTAFVIAAIFAGGSTLVALLGLYGVLSYGITQRRREFGVRMAMGAKSSDIQRMVLGEAARFLAVGLGVGIGMALLVSRLLQSMLFAVGGSDPATYATVIGIITLATIAACEIPAFKASNANPFDAIRAL
jgi:predicted permease